MDSSGRGPVQYPQPKTMDLYLISRDGLPQKESETGRDDTNDPSKPGDTSGCPLVIGQRNDPRDLQGAWLVGTRIFDGMRSTAASARQAQLIRGRGSRRYGECGLKEFNRFGGDMDGMRLLLRP